MTENSQLCEPTIIVLMGVAGAGKTTVGQMLAEQIGWTFVDADDYHSLENRAKLTAGSPLTDSDRSRWLRELNQLLRDAAGAGRHIVLACSALAARYRAALVEGVPGVCFVYLRVTLETARARIISRSHFFHPGLVTSQFQTLEEPSDAIAIDAGRPVLEIMAEIRRRLALESLGE